MKHPRIDTILAASRSAAAITSVTVALEDPSRTSRPAPGTGSSRSGQ